MYNNTILHFQEVAKKKVEYSRNNTLAFFIHSMMAGAYVGLGIILIFSVAGLLDPSVQKLVMGLSFGVALTLVIFAGSELFTGHTMHLSIGWLKNQVTLSELWKIWLLVWVGNLVGSILLAVIYALGHGFLLDGTTSGLLMKVASYKMNSDALPLVARGLLCNWLVCLAIWMAARTESDTTKSIVIFWALFAFISSGYEHSVANMTLLSLALLGNHPDSVTLMGMGHNLLWVTIGNILGGSIFMGLGYTLGTTPSKKALSSTLPES